MKNISKHKILEMLGLCLGILTDKRSRLGRTFKSVTCFLGPKLRIRVTKRGMGCRMDKGDFIVTIGNPNYAERGYLSKHPLKAMTAMFKGWLSPARGK